MAGIRGEAPLARERLFPLSERLLTPRERGFQARQEVVYGACQTPYLVCGASYG